MARRRAQTAPVFSLSEARHARRLKTYRERLDRVLRLNKKAIGRLYLSGQLFTRAGTRAGRDLLLAHEHLLKVLSLLDRLSHEGDVPAPRKAGEVEKVFGELDTLLERTGELTAQTTELMDQMR